MKAPDWHPLAYLPEETRSLLDVGCNVGELLAMAEGLGAERLFGMDINRNAVEKAKERFSSGNHAFYHGSADTIPLENGAVDAVTLCEVIEHVPEGLRERVFAETHRVLKKGGVLILTTPHRGLFHWMDPANMRFRFPRAFRLASRVAGGAGRERGFEGEKHGIVWHHHFTLPELDALFSPYFALEKVRWRGVLIGPLSQYFLFPFYRRENFSHPLYRLIRSMKEWELGWDPPSSLAFNVLLVLRRL